jgi:DNA polymerase-3 subunit delta
MILFLYGDDAFSSHQKLMAIKNKFLAVGEPENLIVKSADEINIAKLPNIFMTQTLLGGKRLIIFKHLLSSSSAELKTSLLDILKEQELDETTVVFYESESFDKRQALYKFLDKSSQSQEFVALKGMILNKKINELASTYNLKISPQITNQLVISSAGDLVSIDNDLKKLSAFASSKTLTQDDIEALLPGNLQLNIFSALESLSKKDWRAFLNVFNQQLEKGEDVVKILGALTYQLRGAVQVFDLSARGLSAGEIAKQTGLHPFAVSQTLGLVRNIKREELVEQYQRLVEVDHQLKTGACAPEDIPSLLVVGASI